jgi:hypothetical protein
MRILDVVVSAAIASVVAVVTTVIMNMAATELQAWLDELCFVLLRLARRRLPADLRDPLHDEEWVPELHHILRRGEARPITRLAQGIAYSLSLLRNAAAVVAALGDSRSAPDARDGDRTVGEIFQVLDRLSERHLSLADGMSALDPNMDDLSVALGMLENCGYVTHEQADRLRLADGDIDLASAFELVKGLRPPGWELPLPDKDT